MGQPFGLLPQFTWATSGGIAGQQGPIFIRGPQPDMFFQATPQQTITAQPGKFNSVNEFIYSESLSIWFHYPVAPQAVTGITTAIKPRVETPKTTGTRPLSTILPSSSGTSTTPTPIRPASSVSTQTLTGTPTNAQAGNPRPAVSLNFPQIGIDLIYDL